MRLCYDFITSLETMQRSRRKKGIGKLVLKLQIRNVLGFQLGMVVQAHSTSTLDAETGELKKAHGQIGLYSEPLATLSNRVRACLKIK